MNLLKELMITVKKKNNVLLDDVKKLNDKVNKLKKRSKKGINKSKELLKSHKVNNDIADILIERLKTINEYDDLNKKGVG